jgi:hypothetical protein
LERSIVLSALTALVASAPQAHAATVQIDVTITFAPPPSTAQWALTGTADLFLAINSASVASFNIGTRIPPDPIFTGHYQPGDPCVGGGTCSVYFSFGGNTFDGNNNHPTYGFQTGNEAVSDPGAADQLLVGIFLPGDPCFSGGVCHKSGTIFAYSVPTQVGTWDVTISATPLPAALPLFAGGLGALGLLGWRRKRKQAA